MEMVQAVIIALRSVILMMEGVLIVRVLCEFKAIRRDSAPFLLLLKLSEPLVQPVRKILIRQSKDMPLKLDISPFVVMLLLYLASVLLKRYSI